MQRMTAKEFMEAILRTKSKPLTPEQEAKLKANGEKLKKLSKEELHRQLKEDANDMY